MFFFNKVRERFPDTSLLKIAAISFLIRAVCLYFARDIHTIYLLQLLHITSYGFMHPTQVYYANAKVAPEDMVKGQALIVSLTTLGGSIGIFAGGWLISGWGVQTMLYLAMGFAVVCQLVFLAVLRSSDQ